MIQDYRRLPRAINDTHSLGWRFNPAFSMQLKDGEFEKPSSVISVTAKNRAFGLRRGN
jgi:hypothetical protein